MESSKRLVILFFFLVFGFAEAQVNRYVVFFTDKEGTPYSVSNPEEFLSQKAVQRRQFQGLAINASDLPVNPEYVNAVSGLGATIVYKTKWMNGVLVYCDASQVTALMALPEVHSIEYVAPGNIPNGGRKKYVNNRNNTAEEVTANQLGMIGINIMHHEGYRGEGITIGIFDSGFIGVNSTSPFQQIFTENRFQENVSYDFVHRNKNIFLHDDHGTRVLSIIGALEENVFTGGAPNATFQLFITEDDNSEYRIEEYNWLFAAERADSAGVDIINTSLGYSTFDNAGMNYSTAQMDGETAVVTRAAQLAAEKGILVVASAGTEGNIASWRIITAPADGRDVLAVGSVNASGVRSSSSSIGPTSDGRIKPDVMTLGVSASIVRSNGTVSSNSGTSFSAPLMTSLAAGLWQRYPQLTNKELMDVIRMSSSQASAPDNLYGYGIPHYTAVKNYLEQLQQDELIAVYPNPVFEDSITLRPKNPEAIQQLYYSLLNLQGQVLEERSVTFNWLTNYYAIDMSALSAGIYFLKVQADGKWYTYRLVKV